MSFGGQFRPMRTWARTSFTPTLFNPLHTVTNVRQLRETLRDIAPASFYEDIEQGLKRAPMALRISP